MLIPIVVSVGIGVAVVIGIFVEQRISDTRLGGPGQKRLLQEALYTGKPPADIDPDRWIAYLSGRRPPAKFVLHAAVVGAVLVGVTVSDILEPGGYGSDDFGHLVLLVIVFALAYGLRWRIFSGSVGWDRPAKAELLRNLERDRSKRERGRPKD